MGLFFCSDFKKILIKVGTVLEVKKNELWLAPVIWLINVLVTGMTGIFVLPCAFYFQAIGLSKETLVQSMGILFSVLTMMMILSLKTKNILTLELFFGPQLQFYLQFNEY